jgi:Flp pilus assembly pilin Flp
VTALRSMLADERGDTMVQYAVVAAALALVMMGALAAIGAECATRMAATGTQLPALGTTPP